MNTQFKLDKNFRGNAYIVKNGEILLSHCSGYADIANKIPNVFNTRFACASMSKTFVAVGILQLIEKNRLSFDDSLKDLLDIDLGYIDSNVTVRQLLTHTSGIADYDDESDQDVYELWANYPNYKIRRNEDLFELFKDKMMKFTPGERFDYSNSGYVLLAMIIEKITGSDFDVYLKENIFDLCSMSSTGYFESDRLPERCANGYIYDPKTDSCRTNIFSVAAKGTGDGGAYVTVEDIIRFWKGLLEYRLLSKSSVDQMFSKQSGNGDDPEEGYYGYGVWIIDNPDGSDYVYMQGLDPGVCTISEYNPNNGMISVLLSNYGDNVWARMRSIRKELY
jgi:CubicO group peptidase (beta-lactamase class C family)